MSISKSNSSPFVSIVIPVYNGANYLKQAIDSALAQTYQNIEILVINDGSSDNGATESIARSYRDKIRYFSKPNGGVASALNLGIRNMRGEYFSWLSHDDWYYPHKLQRQIEALQKSHNPLQIVYSNFDTFIQNEQRLINRPPKLRTIQDRLQSSVFGLFEGQVHGCTLLIHKSHFERVGLFNESLPTTQDYDLWFRMFLGQRLIYLNESLIVFRFHSEQGSKIYDTTGEQVRLYQSMIDNIPEKEISAIYRSPYNFYGYLSDRFYPAKFKSLYKNISRRFQIETMDYDLAKSLQEFRQYINNLSQGHAKRIYIFCSGIWGKRLYHELTGRLIKVDGFCDNDPNKIGHVIDNVYCVSFEELKARKKDTLVIVANVVPSEIVAQLEDAGFPHIATRQQLQEMLFLTPPVKWMLTLDDLTGVDYSLPQNQVLIGELKATLREICMHYLDIK